MTHGQTVRVERSGFCVGLVAFGSLTTVLDSLKNKKKERKKERKKEEDEQTGDHVKSGLPP